MDIRIENIQAFKEWFLATWPVIASLSGILAALISFIKSLQTSRNLELMRQKFIREEEKHKQEVEKLQLEVKLLKNKLDVSERLIQVPDLKDVKSQVEELSELSSVIRQSLPIVNEFLSCQNKLFESQHRLKNLIASLKSDRKNLSQARSILDYLTKTAGQLDELHKVILALSAGADLEQLDSSTQNKRGRLS